ncbi:MAG: hypothetical protein E6R04_01210 [Spirochaetes bacterium]|nr:MAG: hypothetical protein E6R04_01210 [Spirochaetota bacterium]
MNVQVLEGKAGQVNVQFSGLDFKDAEELADIIQLGMKAKVAAGGKSNYWLKNAWFVFRMALDEFKLRG